MPPSDNTQPVPNQSETSASSDFNTQAFLMQSWINKVNTITLVKVVKIIPTGGLNAVGYVDVQPLVAQLDGAGNAMPHGIIHNLPYFRVQGGVSAVIIDPVIGDLGMAAFASHDISSVKETRDQANPGSRRRFDMADGLYLGGFLNGNPTRYVKLSSDGIELEDSSQIILRSPKIVMDGEVMATGEITARFGTGASVTLTQHRHPGVNQPPSPNT